VICDVYTPSGEPLPTNKRHDAAKIFSHPEVVAEVPWYVFSKHSFYLGLFSFQQLLASRNHFCIMLFIHETVTIYSFLNIYNTMTGMELSKSTPCCRKM